MANPRPTAAHASVVFLKIPEFSQHPVSEQVRLKDRLEGKVAAALACLEEGQRIVLEAPDGAAVVVLGDPAEMIGATARDRGTELIVMGLAADGGIFASRPGSIAYRVLCSTPVPVLVVPGPIVSA